MYIYTREYYSANKRNEYSTWMNLKISVVSEKKPDKKEYLLYWYKVLQNANESTVTENSGGLGMGRRAERSGGG